MIRFSGKTKSIQGKTKDIKKAIKSIAAEHRYSILQIDYIFVDDNALLEINRQALKHDYYTDIITFDYTEDKRLEGEIYISIDRVKENALTFSEEFHVELYRVIFHGLLHMLGYKDKTKTDKTEMRKMENLYLKLMSA